MPVAETLGGALFGSFLSVLFDRLSSRQVLDYFRGRKLDEKLPKRLKVELRSVNAVVEDAEQKQFSDSNVKEWLDDVTDAVFDAEDLLDEIDYEVSKCMLEAESRTSASFDTEIESRMNEVLDELKHLAKQKDDLGLKNANTSDGVGLGGQVSRKLPSTSLVAESVIYGRHHEIDTVFNWLTPSIENGNQLSIISIVGMGGLGKTTLAQHVYNDTRMEMEEYKFGIKAWVCVSDDFDVFKVTRKILEAITKSTDDSRDLEIVQGRLKDKLIGKRFLLVLDDVWNEKREEWEALQTPLNYGAPGSKILVTTRSAEVASCMRSNETHRLKPLQDENCWKLLAKHAFNDENLQLNPEFKNIGMQIVKKCDGLPLALKTIGGLLYNKSSVSEWESVLKSKIWKLPEQYNNIIPALLLSYYHLPSPLKRCFAFCALFPKDYQFDKEDLILLWMAENFLQCPQQTKSMEEVGKQYFDDLLSRSFFQQSTEVTPKRLLSKKIVYPMCYVMHDLLNDLAKYVCGDFCFMLGVEEEQKISEKSRHFSFFVSKFEWFKYKPCKFERFKGLYEPSKLRTFLPVSSSPWGIWMLTMPTDDFFSKFRFVRVLSLSGCKNLTEVPDLVCSLKHLRSLDLSSTKIEKLPDSICSLFNLQILKLRFCQSLKELPLGLQKLTKLCHLDIRATVLRKFPEHLGKLENLKVLMSSFCVGEGSEFNIQQLGELNLHGRLEISEMQNMVTVSNALRVNFKNKMKLTWLELKWSEKHDDSLREKNVLENLPRSKYLEELSIYGYGGTEFPSWLGNDSFSNVVSLKLHKCENCILLPSLGLLPSLKYLAIIGLRQIVAIGAEFYGSSTSSFASLETLVFKGMEEWETWECKAVMGAFPCLRELSIVNCPKLKEHLPEQLPCLMELKIHDCNQLVASLPRAPAIQKLSLMHCGKILFARHPSTLILLRLMKAPWLNRHLK